MKAYRLPSLFITLCTFICTFSPAIQAKVLWRGDFETNDFSQWDYTLHPAGFSITHDCVSQGKSAVKITLNGDERFLWQGRTDLNRSELQYKPSRGKTVEGKDTFFRFSFYLPQPLSSHQHAIGYWESHGSFQQMMRFNITGTELSFQETTANQPFWRLPVGASAQQWHQLRLHIHWSTKQDQGFVRTWVDGKDMGEKHFQTLNINEASMFTQLGILRHQEDSTETIVIDDAMETDNLDELEKPLPVKPIQTCKLQ